VYRYTIALLVVILLVIVFGAAYTSLRQEPENAGAMMGVACVVHIVLGAVVVLMALGFAIQATKAAALRSARPIAWVTLGLLIVAAGLMYFAAPVAGVIIHASLGPLVLAHAVILMLRTSPPFQGEPQTAPDYGWPSLRSMSLFVPALVMVQIVMGAMLRHKVSTVIPHMVGAMITAIFILMLTMFVLNQFPEHPVLKPSARVLLVLTLVQIFLGLGAFIGGTMGSATSPAILALAVAHVTNGAAVMGASMGLGTTIRRFVRPKGT
jgi:heme A synthase